MDSLIKKDLTEGVTTLTLSNGKVNAFSHALIAEFNAHLDQAETDSTPVVITGQPGIFSGGYDLTVMKESMQAAMGLVKEGSTLARRLLSFPTPVISACSGHAVAKGAFILLSSDVRLGVDGPFKIGLNEVAIGMTMHHAGIELARARLPASYFVRSVLCAEMFNPKDAVRAGFLDMVVGAEALLPQAQAMAQQLAKLDMRAHKQTKLKARKALLETLDWAIAEDAEGSL